MSNTLLPCPFCGSENIVTTDFGASTWFVQCDDCGATFPHFDTETEAIAAWNRRTGKGINVTTNADRIRSMSDEELAREMLFFVPSDFNRHYTGIAGGYYATADEAIQANFDWLQQPVKEE